MSSPNNPSKPNRDPVEPSRRQALGLGTAALLGAGVTGGTVFAAPTARPAGAVDHRTLHHGDTPCQSCSHWQEFADRVAVADVIMRERLARETHNWADEAACFHPASIVIVSWFKGSGAEFIEAGKKSPDTEDVHFDSMSPGVIWIKNDRAIADTASAVHTYSQFEGIDVSTTSYTRLRWLINRLKGQWLIARLRDIYIRDTLIPRDSNQAPKLYEEKLSKFDTSYRYLSYVHNVAGRPSHNDLAGVDKPEGVAALGAAETEG